MDIGIRKNSNLFTTKKMNKNDGLLNNVHPDFVPLLERVLHSNGFGVTRGKIELLGVTSSQGNNIGDRFNISIPYAKQTLRWTVMFDATHPEIGPDFDFNDKTFLSNPNIHKLERQLPHLVSWKTANINSLLNVLKELVFCYKLHEKEKMTERLSTEYLTLVQSSKVVEEDLEIILLPEPYEAHFLIRITPDFPQLPKKYESDNIDIMLHVIYQGLNFNRTTAQICFSSSLNDILGNVNNIRFPQISPSKSLVDYVISIQNLIVNKVETIITDYEMKKSYIQALLCLQEGSVIEYDASDFTFIAILLSHQDFYVLIRFNFPSSFPADPPEVILQSIYNLFGTNSDIYKDVLTPYYNLRWDSEKMVKGALLCIRNAINGFKYKTKQLYMNRS